MKKLTIACIIILFSLIAISVVHASVTEVKIGVLSIRGKEATLKEWQQVSEHLEVDIPDYRFVIVPLEYKELDSAVANKELDFVVANPSEYILFEKIYGVTRIATCIKHFGGIETTQFGSVFFTKATRTDIQSLSDIRGKSLVTVSETAFASWLVSRDELKRQGVSVSDLASVKFFGTPFDKIVMAVKNGDADIGAIRTDVLEKMAQEGKIELKDFRIINQKHVEGFPFFLSSELYPEFPIARLKHTDKKLANRVTASLLLLSHNPTSSHPDPIGWTVPENYESVRKLLQEWKISPYESYGKVTLKESIRQHWGTVALATLLVVAVLLIAFLRLRIIQRKIKYRDLEIEKQNLANHHVQVIGQRDELAHQKAELEAALAHVKLLEGIIPICSYCKKIRDDENSWHQLEQYISSHSEVLFSHGICPHCYKEQMEMIKKMR